MLPLGMGSDATGHDRLRSGDVLEHADALAAGKAYAVLGGYARIDVHGGDAVDWLQDLLTAEIASLPVGGARRSFLLTPTGRIRADVRVIRREDRIELLEPAEEPVSVATRLAPYVLSSHVSLSDPVPVQVGAFPATSRSAGRIRDVLSASRMATSSPSLLGDGTDTIIEGPAETLIRAVGDVARRVDEAAADVLRIHRGIPAWRIDLQPDGYPVGTRVEDAVAEAKGCFLGQEAVAKIRNLGHPPTILRHLVTTSRPRPGDPVLLDGEPVGHVTSAAPSRDGTVVLAVVKHAAARRELSFAGGATATDAAAGASDVGRRD